MTAGGPIRVQLRRTKGWRKPANTVVVSRPSKWGNPYVAHRGAIDYVREFAVHMFKQDLYAERLSVSLTDVTTELRGKNLACWCPLPKPGEPDLCHAAVLLEVANR